MTMAFGGDADSGIDQPPAEQGGPEDRSWSRLEISIAVAIGLVIAIGIAYVASGGVGRQGSGSTSPTETPTPEAIDRPFPSPAEVVGTRITLEQFVAHANQFALENVPLLRRLTDAQEAGDLVALGAAADQLNVLVEAELDWQRANADRILGGCYDDAAAVYSDAVIDLAAATNYSQIYADGQDPDLRFLISDLMTDFSEELGLFQTELANVSC